MDRLTGKAELCRERALLCEALADHRHCDEYKRSQYRTMARHWFALARTFKLAEDVSGFLDWASRRMEPPEAFKRAR